MPQQVLGRFNSFLKSVILRASEARDPGDFDRFVTRFTHEAARQVCPGGARGGLS